MNYILNKKEFNESNIKQGVSDFLCNMSQAVQKQISELTTMSELIFLYYKTDFESDSDSLGKVREDVHNKITSQISEIKAEINRIFESVDITEYLELLNELAESLESLTEKIDNRYNSLFKSMLKDKSLDVETAYFLHSMFTTVKQRLIPFLLLSFENLETINERLNYSDTSTKSPDSFL